MVQRSGEGQSDEASFPTPSANWTKVCRRDDFVTYVTYWKIGEDETAVLRKFEWYWKGSVERETAGDPARTWKTTAGDAGSTVDDPTVEDLAADLDNLPEWTKNVRDDLNWVEFQGENNTCATHGD